MKKWNVFAVYAEDSKDVYKMIIPAPSKKEAELYVKNGGLEIVKTKEMAELRINVDFLSSYLRKGDFDILEPILEEYFNGEVEDVDLNDFFWFERDTIASWLGYENYEELMHDRV